MRFLHTKSHLKRILVCVLVCMVAQVAFSGTAEAQHAVDESGAGATLGLRITTPITSKDVSRWAKLLDASDEQRAYFEWCLERYTTQAEELLSKTLPHIQELGRTGGTASLERNVGLWIESGNQLNEEELELIERVRQLDLEFMGEFQRVLAEPQREHWPRVENRRIRDRSRCILTHVFIPGSNVDLSSTLYELGLTLDEVAEFDDILREYETALHPVWIELVAVMNRSRDPNIANLGAVLFDSNTTGAKREEALRRYEEQTSTFSADLARLSRQVVSQNDEYLKRIMERLPVKRADDIKRLYYKERYFRFAYHDPLNPDWLLERIAKLSSMNDEQRLLVNNAIAEFGQKYEALCEEIRQHDLDKMEAYVRNYSTIENLAYDAKIEDVRKRRLELCKRTVDEIAGILPSEAIAEMERALNQYHTRLRQAS